MAPALALAARRRLWLAAAGAPPWATPHAAPPAQAASWPDSREGHQPGPRTEAGRRRAGAMTVRGVRVLTAQPTTPVELEIV